MAEALGLEALLEFTPEIFGATEAGLAGAEGALAGAELGAVGGGLEAFTGADLAVGGGLAGGADIVGGAETLGAPELGSLGVTELGDVGGVGGVQLGSGFSPEVAASNIGSPTVGTMGSFASPTSLATGLSAEGPLSTTGIGPEIATGQPGISSTSDLFQVNAQDLANAPVQNQEQLSLRNPNFRDLPIPEAADDLSKTPNFRDLGPIDPMMSPNKTFVGLDIGEPGTGLTAPGGPGGFANNTLNASLDMGPTGELLNPEAPVTAGGTGIMPDSSWSTTADFTTPLSPGVDDVGSFANFDLGGQPGIDTTTVPPEFTSAQDFSGISGSGTDTPRVQGFTQTGNPDSIANFNMGTNTAGEAINPFAGTGQDFAGITAAGGSGDGALGTPGLGEEPIPGVQAGAGGGAGAGTGGFNLTKPNSSLLGLSPLQAGSFGLTGAGLLMSALGAGGLPGFGNALDKSSINTALNAQKTINNPVPTASEIAQADLAMNASIANLRQQFYSSGRNPDADSSFAAAVQNIRNQREASLQQLVNVRVQQAIQTLGVTDQTLLQLLRDRMQTANLGPLFQAAGRLFSGQGSGSTININAPTGTTVTT